MSVAATRTPLETVIDALTARGKNPKGNGVEYTALCPAHDDSTPSLSIGTGNDGRALLHCHTGCSLDRILDALDLTDKDLFAGPPSNGSDISATYDYVDETGTLLFQVVRKVGKQFVQRRPDGNGGWIWKLGNTRRVLYRLPEVVRGIAAGETIFVVEGEKDADRLAAEKITATCNPHGAGKWRPEYNATLKGANVVIVADSDPTGRAHAVDVADQLDGIAATVQTVEGAAGKDISDHLAAGYTVEQLVLVDLETTAAPERTPTSWAPIDLTDALTGQDVTPPELWHRTDGLTCIYAGRVHWFQGESESCKSWAAQIIVADELKAGHDVLYLDFEDDERGVVARLRSLGVTPQQIKTHLIYLRPDEALRDRHGAYTDAWTDFASVLDHTYRLCVLDGVTEAMTTEGLQLLDNTDIASWMRLLPRRIAATGAAVICIDHVTKAADTQGRYAIGGQHKLAGLSGAAYKFTLLRPLARAIGTEPIEGATAVTIMKDRPGYVRGRAPEGKVGTLTITAYPDGAVTTALEPPGTTTVADMAIVGRILSYLDTYDGTSQTRITENVEGGTDPIREALRWLTAEEQGWVRVEKKGQSHLHFLTEIGQEKVPHNA